MNTQNPQNQETLENLEKYTIEATETDMRTIETIFGEKQYLNLDAEDPFTKIDASINVMFASSHVLLRVAALLNKCPNPEVSKSISKLSLVFAMVGKNLLEKNDGSFEEGIFNELTTEDIQPILDILNGINIELPEGL